MHRAWKFTTKCTETRARINRGDVVIIRFAQGKARPAVVVQCDHNNARLLNTILAQVTSNIRLASQEPTQVLIEVATAEGKASGLKVPSAVKCENIATQPMSDIRYVIGRLPDSLMQQVDAALKASLSLK